MKDKRVKNQKDLLVWLLHGRERYTVKWRDEMGGFGVSILD